MKKYFNRIVAVIITIALAVSGVHVDASAEKNTEDKAYDTRKKTEMQNIVGEVETTEPTIVQEIKDERTLNSSTYLLSNGMKRSVYYTDNVRFEDEYGKIEDYNPKLVLVEEENVDEIADAIVNIDSNKKLSNKKLKNKIINEYVYENKAGDSKQYFPKYIGEDTPVVMVKDEYRVSFAPINECSEHKTDENILGASGEILVSEAEVTNLKDEEVKQNVIAEYNFSNSEVKIEYQSLEKGVKECIILDKVPKNNVFSYTFTMENAEARLDAEGGGITIYDAASDSIIGGIEAPFMNDATNNAYSEQVYYELSLVGSNACINEYILSIVVDENYLKNESRQYPVTIAPSLTWKTNDNLQDAYVYSGASSANYYSNSVKTMSAGNNSNGQYRTYIRVLNLLDEIEGRYVDNAELIVYENGSSTKDAKIQVGRAKSEFKCKEITWSNKPSVGTVYDTITVDDSINKKHTFNVTQWARNIANGTAENYGLVLKAEDENISSYSKFYGSRTGVTAYVPKIVIEHFDAPTEPDSVTISKQYLKSGEDLTVNWSGISSQGLDYVHYYIMKQNSSTGIYEAYKKFSSSTKIGTTSSGVKTISESSNWPEGNYS